MRKVVVYLKNGDRFVHEGWNVYASVADGGALVIFSSVSEYNAPEGVRMFAHGEWLSAEVKLA